ncbi:ATP-dependent RecD-like DNA helicase [Gracilibacillus caseinilyticus]|uniref:ATP-dependent RecD2 DNA helicase n=1 Tax=Gracilibacillus caseinilyticus TaxID=2932256 RepID=A0ABY4ETX8_9BACI|nr:ATP-dependent RecD-like DNA helicase [Gracilibacillus caseinilyticus]UOQ47343.1 ATP-dependent RecD-like DNA helicase [Gracilibacillus caseinilyticus]
MENEPEVEEKNFIKGEMIHTIFENKQEHFSIAKIKVLETNQTFDENEVVVKGYFRRLDPGETYEFYGRVVDHKRFGRQFQVESYQRFLPQSKEGIVAYLSSDLFPGVGKKTAERIVDTLGDTALSMILNDQKVLNKVRGITDEKQKKIYQILQENQGFEGIVVELSKYGFGLKMAQKMYTAFKEETLDTLKSNPYQFVFQVESFGFLRADQIARQNEISIDHPTRLQAACVYILQNSVQDGHAYLPLDRLLYEMDQLLDGEANAIDVDKMTAQIVELNKEKEIIVSDQNAYMPSLYYSETGFCAQVKRIADKKQERTFTDAELLKIVGGIEEEETLSYGKEQYQALETALSEKIFILTGGPGTGKTTVIKGIINAYADIHDLSLDKDDYRDDEDFPFVLTAPTGRAAKRMKESTGIDSVTIHRLLGWDGQESFDKDENNQLTGKIIVIDEFSMVDIWLAYQLFRAIPDDMQVIIVGDEDQLPSVGPGQVLADLLKSSVVASISLKEVYRQKEGSKIIQLAHEIKNNQVQPTTLSKANDFNFFSCPDYQVIEIVKQVVKKAYDKGVDQRQIQVLAPMYRSKAGILRLNEELQAILNPRQQGRREMAFGDTVFRKGDKVIQLVNQAEDGVFNGDIGEVVAIFEKDENVDQEEQVVVSFDEKEVAYAKADLMNLMHAYCTSIHKSQGSEFQIVIMPVISGYNRMLRKNLLYTGITRAKQSLVMCGDKQAFLKGVHTEDTNKRYTNLVSFLHELFHVKEEKSDKDKKEISADEWLLSVDVGQEDFSPYDFMV